MEQIGFCQAWPVRSYRLYWIGKFTRFLKHRPLNKIAGPVASLGLPIFKPVGPWVCLPSRWCTGPKTRQTLLLATEARGRCPGRVVRLVKLYIEDDGSNPSTRHFFLHIATKFKDTKLSRVIKILTILANTFWSIDTSRKAFPAMPAYLYFDQFLVSI